MSAPAGLLHAPVIATPEEEGALLEHLARLELSGIRMRGQVARRRTAHFGWLYGYETGRVEPGPPLPGFLQSLRERAAALADVAPAELTEALVTEYPAGAGIGWHRDAPAFGVVIGVSLLGACRLRFRRNRGETRLTWAMDLAPRAAYVLTGAARWQWQHSIPPVRTPRWSVTFRTLRDAGARAPRAATPRRPS